MKIIYVIQDIFTKSYFFTDRQNIFGGYAQDIEEADIFQSESHAIEKILGMDSLDKIYLEVKKIFVID